MVFTASIFALITKGIIWGRAGEFAYCVLGKGTCSPFLCNNRVVGPSSQPAAVAQSSKRSANRARAYRIHSGMSVIIVDQVADLKFAVCVLNVQIVYKRHGQVEPFVYCLLSSLCMKFKLQFVQTVTM